MRLSAPVPHDESAQDADFMTFEVLHSAACCALAIALAACSASAGNEREAAGSVDTSIAKTSALVDAAGPGVQVTRTDSGA